MFSSNGVILRPLELDTLSLFTNGRFYATPCEAHTPHKGLHLEKSA